MDPHQKKLIERAVQMGIRVETMEEQWGVDAVRLHWRERSTTVLYGRVFPHLNTVADTIASNKIASSALMRELGIPVPDNRLLSAGDIDMGRIEEFVAKYRYVVAKPLSGTDGRGVAMYLESAGEVLAHIGENLREGDGWLLEEQAEGEDLRLQYLGGRLVAACIRRPCTLRGDGERTIGELIEDRNRLIAAQNPDNRIDIDHQVKRRLDNAGCTLSSVLPDGETMQIKDVSNMAQGGHAIDVTDRVHPGYAEYLHRLAASLGIRFFSLDVMTPSPEADPDRYARVLELNAQSAWLHHTFSEGRQHDIARMLLEDCFGISD